LSFASIEYNFKSNKIHLWEYYGGEKVKVEEDFVNEYYVQCNASEATHKDIHSTPMKKKIGGRKQDIDMLKQSGLKVAESDLPPEMKFLHQRYGGVKDLKPVYKDYNVCFIDIEIASEGEFPKPEEAKYPINLISVKSSKTGRITTFGSDEYTGNSELVQDYYHVPDEERLMEKFIKWFRKQKFDIITGWNVLNFDMAYIFQRCINLTGEEALGKAMSPVNRVKLKRNGEWNISGVTVLDYLELYKNFTFDTKVSYSLQSIGMIECDEGKLDLDGSINSIWKTNWNQFVEYNIQDVLLVEKIDNKMQFLELAIVFCHQALIPFDRIFSSISTIEGYMLRALHEHNLVMPDRRSGVQDWWMQNGMYKVKQPNGEVYIQNEPPKDKGPLPIDRYVKGGYVEAKPGLYKHLMSFDVTSLYPHMIIQYNISPETKVTNPTQAQIDSGNLIQSEVNGVWYDKTKKGILPEIVQRIFDERKAFKSEMFNYKKGSAEYGFYDRQQHIRKILINSMYGVLINEFFHFYDVDNARSITRGGRVLIKYLSETTNDWIGSTFHKHGPTLFPGSEPQKIEKHITALIDTDSTYVCLDEIKSKYAHNMDFMDFCDIIEPFIENFYERILEIKANKKGMPQCVDFKREGRITKQFVLAKKKYLTELIQNEDDIFDPPYLKATGVEMKKSDTPAFCREHIEDAVKEIFNNEDHDKSYKQIQRIFKQFKKQPVDKIASVSSVGKFNDYNTKDIAKFKSGTPNHYKASICTNHMIDKYKLPYLKIAQGSKIKYIRINDRNEVGNNAIAWIGNYPNEFESKFKVDYALQFEKTFLGVLTRSNLNKFFE
jgi:DNA polymerase elongation subunit (family B)